MNAVKRIIKYVGGTCDFGLFYSKESNLSLAGLSNSDWTGNADDRKSTTGGCFYVGANLVTWMSKKQNSVSLSTAETEYIAAGSCFSQLLWMKKVLTDYGISQDTMVVYCDNSSAIDISKNLVQHSKIKYTKSHQLLDEGFQIYSIKRFGENVSILTLSRNILKTHNLSFNKIPNEVILNLNVLSFRMLHRVLRYINSTRVITVNNHGILGYPIIS